MVPNGWKILSLGEICNNNLQTGPFGSQLHAHEYIDAGISVVMPKDLINNRVNLESTAKIPKKRADDLKKHYLKSGDIIFSRRGDVSRFALIDDLSEGTICGTGCLKATPSPNHSSEFLSYFLQRDNVKQWLEQNAVGQTMLNINTEILSQLPLITASSIDEEKKIVTILSAWDKAIEVTKKLISNSQAQKRALIQQLLTGKKRLLDENGELFSGKWESKNLGSITKITTGSSNRQDSLDKGLYAFFDRSSETRRSNQYLLDEEAIIVAGEGQEFVPKYFIGKFDLHQRTYAIIKIKTEYHHKFLHYLITFNNHYFLSQAVGSTVKSLRLPMFEKMLLKIPQLQEQKKIAGVLSNADREISLLEKKLEYLKQEKKALMQQLLTGKRRVTIN